MTFEWDPLKAKSNLWKHRVSFEEATTALLDPLSKTATDPSHSVEERFMKNVRHDFADSLRPEYRRSDFGDMVEGKYAYTQLEFAELVRLLVTCVGEDERVNLVHHSIGNQHAGHTRGDWTYEIDNAHQITLRYWLNEFRSIEEAVTNTPGLTTPQERSDLQKLILHHVRTLKAKVDRLKS